VAADTRGVRWRWGVGLVAAVTAVALGGCGGEPFPTAAPKGPPSTSSSSAPSSDGSGVGSVLQRAKIEPVFGSPTTTGVLVDPGEAHDVASRIWSELVQARFERDASGLTKIEFGPALAADLGYLCLPGCRGTLRTADQITVNVPRQQHWPLAFSANVFYTSHCQTTGPPCHDIFVVVQEAKGAPWKIAHYVTYTGTSFADQPALLSDGWAESPTPNPILNGAPAEYAAYLVALNRTGRPPATTHLSAEWFTNNAPEVQRATRSLNPLGFRETLAYRTDPTDPLWHFAGSNSVQFVCGTFHFTETVTGTQNQRIVQPPDLSVLGDKVRPGIYTRVTIFGLHMACFEQHAGEDALSVMGEWGDATTATVNQ
jgi:hypothetical protein